MCCVLIHFCTVPWYKRNKVLRNLRHNPAQYIPSQTASRKYLKQLILSYTTSLSTKKKFTSPVVATLWQSTSFFSLFSYFTTSQLWQSDWLHNIIMVSASRRWEGFMKNWNLMNIIYPLFPCTLGVYFRVHELHKLVQMWQSLLYYFGANVELTGKSFYIFFISSCY